VAAVTAGIMAVSSVVKRRELSGGGDVLARALGGRPVGPATKDLKQRQLLNVVEELALAAGTPVPRVYLLEQERGINAFAAGLEPRTPPSPSRAARSSCSCADELQGVLAHEFSHILNGDMALNVRLMALLHASSCSRSSGGARCAEARRASLRRPRPVQRGAVPMAIGALVWAIGSIGVLFARLIKAGVSRERERLADAAAVQFTRNAAGLAGALKKIGGWRRDPACTASSPKRRATSSSATASSAARSTSSRRIRRSPSASVARSLVRRELPGGAVARGGADLAAASEAERRVPSRRSRRAPCAPSREPSPRASGSRVRSTSSTPVPSAARSALG
jgi:Zn-dependent protease with chaperone function